MLENIKNKLKYVFQFLKSSFVHVICVAGLIKLTGIHFGLIGLIMTHPDPNELLQVIEIIISKAKISSADLYPILRTIPLENFSLTLLGQQMTELSTQQRPLTAEILKTNIRLQTSPNELITNRNIKEQLNDAEAAHAPSVTISAATSTRMLIKRYPEAARSLTKDEKTQIELALRTLAPAYNLTRENTQDIEKALKIINQFDEVSSQTGVTLKQLTNLTWHAVNDLTPEAWSSNENPEQNRFLRRSFFFKSLIAIAQVSRQDALRPESKLTLCFSGIYTSLLETLDRTHVDVTLYYVDLEELFHQRLKELFWEHYEALSSDEKRQLPAYEASADQGNASIKQWINSIHPSIEAGLIAEFSSHLAPEKIRSYCRPEYLHWINLPPLSSEITPG